MLGKDNAGGLVAFMDGGEELVTPDALLFGLFEPVQKLANLGLSVMLVAYCDSPGFFFHSTQLVADVPDRLPICKLSADGQEPVFGARRGVPASDAMEDDAWLQAVGSQVLNVTPKSLRRTAYFRKLEAVIVRLLPLQRNDIRLGVDVNSQLGKALFR